MKEFGTADPNVSYTERQGSYGIAVRGDSVLIEIARLGYFLPGGGIEMGEAPEDALQRELLEETGYELLSWTKLGVAIDYREHIKKVGHFYAVALGQKGEPTCEDGHVFPVEWIPYSEIQEKMHLASQWWAIERALTKRS